MKKLNNFILHEKGFTFIEMIVVLVIIGLLATIWASYNRGQLNSAYMNEAKMFADKIVTQEKIYFSEKNTFAYTPKVTKLDSILLDTKQNNYYKYFSIQNGGSGKLLITLEIDSSNQKIKSKLSGYNINAIYDPETGKTTYSKKIS